MFTWQNHCRQIFCRHAIDTGLLAGPLAGAAVAGTRAARLLAAAVPGVANGLKRGFGALGVLLAELQAADARDAQAIGAEFRAVAELVDGIAIGDPGRRAVAVDVLHLAHATLLARTQDGQDRARLAAGAVRVVYRQSWGDIDILRRGYAKSTSSGGDGEYLRRFRGRLWE